jgi:N-acetylneuraminic acid mutarotase
MTHLRLRPLALALLALAALPAGAAADSWGAAAAMPSSRFGHSAGLLANGKVMVTAGDMIGRSNLASTLVYDPTANVWLGAPDLTPGRDSQMASVLANGDVLVTGGQIAGMPSQVTAQTATFLAATNSWRASPSMPDAHAKGTQTTLADGRVLVAGGFSTASELSDLSGTATTAADVYDSQTDSWRRAASLPSGHARDQAVLLKDGTVLVVGGTSGNTLATAVRYDPTTDRWSDAGTMSSPRRNFTATALPDGRVLVAGGTGIRSAMNGSTSTWSSAELYDPTTNRWSDAAPMATPRAQQTATLLQSGKVLVVGGSGGRGPLASTELFDPATDS